LCPIFGKCSKAIVYCMWERAEHFYAQSFTYTPKRNILSIVIQWEREQWFFWAQFSLSVSFSVFTIGILSNTNICLFGMRWATVQSLKTLHFDSQTESNRRTVSGIRGLSRARTALARIEVFVLVASPLLHTRVTMTPISTSHPHQTHLQH